MKHEDFGIKIGGARKDFRGNFTPSDIEAMNHLERSKHVRKDMVWPTPDYAKMVSEGGVDRQVVALIKMVRDCLPSVPFKRPDPTESQFLKACHSFVSLLNKIKPIEKCKTQEEIVQFLEKPELKSLLGEKHVFPARNSMSFQGGADFLQIRADMGLMNSEGREILSTLGYAIQGRLSWNMQALLRRNSQWPLANSRAETVIRKRKLSIGPNLGGSGFVIYRYDSPISESTFDYLKENTEFGEVLGKVYESKEEGEKSLREAIEGYFKSKLLSRADKMKLILGEDQSGATYRKGPQVRERNVIGEDYLADFGMRGGEFGNWVNNTERQVVLDRGYDAFVDLAAALKIDPGAISLNGRLAIAFGSRGKGGKHAAAAHYEPAREVFNLTKPRGEGCVAHEYAHFLDHYMGREAIDIGLIPGKKTESITFLSAATISDSALQNVAPENLQKAKLLLQINKAMKSIVAVSEVENVQELAELYQKQTIEQKDRSIKRIPALIERVRSSLRLANVVLPDLDEKVEKFKTSLLDSCDPSVFTNSSIDTIVAEKVNLYKEIFGKRLHTGLLKQDVTNLYDRIAWAVLLHRHVTSPEYKPKTHMRSSEYKNACNKADAEIGFKKSYYSLPEEMFARSFEAVVKDELNRNDRDNPFLVGATRSCVYPRGEERERIKKAIYPLLIEYGKTLPNMKRERTNPQPDLVHLAVSQTTSDLAPEPVPASDQFQESPAIETTEPELGAAAVSHPEEIEYDRPIHRPKPIQIDFFDF